LARLQAEGLRPSPQADKSTLNPPRDARLTGLPPTPAEGDAFFSPTAPAGAYERLVDRLLESPRYGEHMARFWLTPPVRRPRTAASDNFRGNVPTASG